VKITKSTWTLYFPEEVQTPIIFNKINRNLIAEFDWFSRYPRGKDIKINFLHVLEGKKSPFLKFMHSVQDKSYFCISPEGRPKKSLIQFLSEKGEKFKVIMECPTGLTLEGTFIPGSTLSDIVLESSKIYLAAYDTCFNLTKQGESVPGFHEMYFRKLCLYEVNGVKTIVIVPQSDKKITKGASKYGRSVSLISITGESQRESTDLEDLYKDL
jgi:hypothetical protein